MKISEQFRRILKAAPHFPVQTYAGVGFLVALPFCLAQLYASAPFNWIKTEAFIRESKPVQQRFRTKEAEHYYSLDYAFNVGDHQYSIPFEKAFTDQRQAEEDLRVTLNKAAKVFVWYNRTNPSIASFQASRQWQLYLVIVIVMLILLAYFRWMMLKYYEMELSREPR